MKNNVKSYEKYIFPIIAVVVLFFAFRSDGSVLNMKWFGIPGSSVFKGCSDTISLVLLFSLLILLILHLCNCNETIMMGVAVAVAMIGFALVIPNGRTPDEASHFRRAFDLASSRILPLKISDRDGGSDYLPAAVLDFENPNAELDYNDICVVSFSNTALYSPVGYVPQAVGIRIAMLFTNNVSRLFTGGRISNMIVAFILCVLALKAAPFGKRIIFWLIMLPVNLQVMISMSTDGTVFALAVLWTVYIMKLREQQEMIRGKQIASLFIMGALLSQCKIVYIVLLFLVFLLPRTIFRNNKSSMLIRGGVFSTALLLNLVWLIISAGYLISFNPGVDPAGQVQYILSHPAGYIRTVLWTTMNYHALWLMELGRIVSGYAEIQEMVWLILWAVLFIEFWLERGPAIDYTLKDVVFLCFTAIAGIVLIYTSLYVQWTPVGSEMIDGIQGRYFLPLAFPAMCLLIQLRRRAVPDYHGQKKNTSPFYLMSVLLFCSAVVLLNLQSWYLR